MSIDKERKKTVKIINKKLTNSEKQLLTIYKGSLNNIRGQLLSLNERSEWTLNELRKYDRLQKLQLEIYKEIKDVSLKTYNEIRRTNKDIFITDYDRSSYAITKEADIFLDFSKLNAEKINAIVNMPYPNVPLKDFIKKIGSDTYEKLKVILGTNMATGNSLQNASKQIKDLLGVSYRKALTISRTEGLRASSKAQLDITEQAIDKGLDIRKRWMSTLDKKTRETHANLDGQLADKKGYFHSGSHKAKAPRMFGVAREDVNCFPDNVEVLTENGYKLFSELKGNEKIASLNPETYELEYVNIKNVIKKEYKGELYNLKNFTADISCTPNHDIYYLSGWKFNKDKNRKLERKQIKDILNDDRIPKTIKKWNGKDKEYIQIRNKKYKTDLFMQFMGWFLSEGSVGKVNNTRYQICINQNMGKNYDEINSICLSLFNKVWSGNTKIYVRDDNLGEYLIKLGYSYEKYIPKELKELDIKYLRLFLDCFNKGDGSIVKNKSKNKEFRKKNFKDRKLYFTSSKQLADDIGELILKCSNYPSFKFPKEEDYNKEVNFGNGTYKIKHPCIWIGENITRNYMHKKENLKIQQYDGMVYCVELEKNHIMNVRQNGKTIFMGNCRCTYVEEIVDMSEPLEKRMDNETKQLIDNMTYNEWYEKYRVKS